MNECVYERAVKLNKSIFNLFDIEILELKDEEDGSASNWIFTSQKCKTFKLTQIFIDNSVF